MRGGSSPTASLQTSPLPVARLVSDSGLTIQHNRPTHERAFEDAFQSRMDPEQ